MIFRNKLVGFLGFLLMTGLLSYAQEGVSFTAKLSKQKLGINERLRVEFVMNKDGDNFDPPDFRGFNVVMGPSQSVSSSWINGVQNFSKTYYYILTPTARGRFAIGQATVEINGKKYKTLPQTVRVTAAVDNPNAPKTANDIAGESIHLVAEISKNDPYLNEAVTVVYKLYVDLNNIVTDYRIIDEPTYHNFWSQEVPGIERMPQKGTYQGKPYRYVVQKKVVLYPQKSGKLNIDPLSLEVVVEIPTNRKDFFGQRIYTQTSRIVSSARHTLDVKPLPETGKPTDFKGAVGDFKFSVTTNKTQLNASESFQTQVAVSGNGNLKLFPLPEPELPSALEVYEPQYKEEISVPSSGIQGKVANSYTVVPEFRGKYTIPGIAFSYFNPKTEKYLTHYSKDITINVLGGPAGNTPGNTNGAAASPQSIVPKSNSFHFVKLSPNLSPISARYFFGSPTFYVLWVTPLLLLALAIFFLKKRGTLAGDAADHKVKRANKLAKKYLSTAKKALGHKEAFYVAMEKGLHNYLKAKLKLETSELSKEKITRILQESHVEAEAINGFIALLKSCEIARYSPFSNVQMQNDYKKASTVIATLDKQL